MFQRQNQKLNLKISNFHRRNQDLMKSEQSVATKWEVKIQVTKLKEFEIKGDLKKFNYG